MLLLFSSNKSFFPLSLILLLRLVYPILLLFQALTHLCISSHAPMKTKHGKRRLERRGGGDGRRGEEIGGEEIGGKEESENYRISQKLVLWRTIK